jgi:SAM-dependent methyltransferase
MEQTHCYLCGSSQLSVHGTLTDLLLEREDVETTLVKCGNCGLIYQYPHLSQENYNRHYPPEYDSYQSENLESSDLSSRVSRLGLSKRRKFVSSIKGEGKLLDLGCATGNFMRAMQISPDWELFGVEINEHAAKIARQEFLLNVFHGELEQANFPNDYFDVVTLWDVLEHLPDPQFTLSEIYRVLKKDGVLILRIPNGNSWDARLFGRFWFGLDAPRHFYIFNRKTITKLLDLSGFQVKRLVCNIGSSIALPMNIRFLMASKKTPENMRNFVMRVVSNPIIKLIVLPFTFLFDQLLLGSFLTVAAGKKEITDD